MEPISFIKDEEFDEGFMERIQNGEQNLRDQALLMFQACDRLMDVINAIPERVRRNFVEVQAEAEAVALILGAVPKEERPAAAEILIGEEENGSGEAEPDGEVQDA